MFKRNPKKPITDEDTIRSGITARTVCKVCMFVWLALGLYNVYMGVFTPFTKTSVFTLAWDQFVIAMTLFLTGAYMKYAPKYFKVRRLLINIVFAIIEGDQPAVQKNLNEAFNYFVDEGLIERKTSPEENKN